MHDEDIWKVIEIYTNNVIQIKRMKRKKGANSLIKITAQTVMVRFLTEPKYIDPYIGLPNLGYEAKQHIYICTHTISGGAPSLGKKR